MASCMQCMGPVRDTAERKRHDQTANYSNQVVLKVPASSQISFGLALPSAGDVYYSCLGRECDEGGNHSP